MEMAPPAHCMWLSQPRCEPSLPTQAWLHSTHQAGTQTSFCIADSRLRAAEPLLHWSLLATHTPKTPVPRTPRPLPHAMSIALLLVYQAPVASVRSFLCIASLTESMLVTATCDSDH